MDENVLEGKDMFFNVGSGEIHANMSAMKTLAALVDGGFDQQQLIGMITDGEFEPLAELFAKSFGVSATDAYDDIAKDKVLNLYFVSADRIFRITKEPSGDDAYYQPIKGATRSLREEARMVISKEIKAHVASSEDGSTLANLYEIAIAESRVHAKGLLYDAEPGDEYAPVPMPAPTGAAQQQVIRERVIEREKEPVLETMLREAMMKSMAEIAVDDMVPKIKEKIIEEFGFEPVKHEVKVLGSDEKQKFEGVTHERFDEVLHCIANDLPVYLYGPAGSGKNVLTEQCAKALDLDYYFMNSVTDEYKIAGFIDANGIYHETEFYKAFTNGGVFFLDEVDASAPEVLVCLNAAIANRYFAFPTGAVQAHKDFRVVAAGNTLGTGSDASYTGRLQLDAASLNRFVIIPIDYDRRIDMFNAQNDAELCDFIADYRKALKACGLAGVASYRNIAQIKALEPVMPLERALCYCLTKEMNKDDINTMIGRDFFKSGNRYARAFKSVESIMI